MLSTWLFILTVASSFRRVNLREMQAICHNFHLSPSPGCLAIRMLLMPTTRLEDEGSACLLYYQRDFDMLERCGFNFASCVGFCATSSSFCKLFAVLDMDEVLLAPHASVYSPSLPSSILSRLDNPIMHDIVDNGTVIMQRS